MAEFGSAGSGLASGFRSGLDAASNIRTARTNEGVLALNTKKGAVEFLIKNIDAITAARVSAVEKGAGESGGKGERPAFDSVKGLLDVAVGRDIVSGPQARAIMENQIVLIKNARSPSQQGEAAGDIKRSETSSILGKDALTDDEASKAAGTYIEPSVTMTRLTPEEVKKVGLDKGTIVQKNSKTGALSILHKKPIESLKKVLIGGKPSWATDSQIMEDMKSASPKIFPPATGMRFRIGKDGELEVVVGGGELSTISAKTADLRSFKQMADVLANIGTLDDLTKRGNVGLIGAFKGIINKTVAQILPSMFSKDRSKFESTVKAVRQMALRVVSDETRFSDADREAIQELFPKTGVFGSGQQEQMKLTVLTALFARRMSGVMERLDIKTVEIPQLEARDIHEAHTEGLLGEDEAAKILVSFWPKEFTLPQAKAN
jgi:hypothetical protein